MQRNSEIVHSNKEGVSKIDLITCNSALQSTTQNRHSVSSYSSSRATTLKKSREYAVYIVSKSIMYDRKTSSDKCIPRAISHLTTSSNSLPLCETWKGVRIPSLTLYHFMKWHRRGRRANRTRTIGLPVMVPMPHNQAFPIVKNCQMIFWDALNAKPKPVVLFCMILQALELFTDSPIPPHYAATFPDILNIITLSSKIIRKWPCLHFFSIVWNVAEL